MLVKFNAIDNNEIYIESHRVVFVEQDFTQIALQRVYGLSERRNG